MIQVAICDDEKKVLDEITGKVLDTFMRLHCRIEVFKTHDPFALTEHIKSSKPDVLFLDIDCELPDFLTLEPLESPK